MRKPIVLLGTLLIALTLGSCGGKKNVDRLFSYVGVVFDSASVTPLDSVEVVIGDTLLPVVQSFTDSLGEYRLELFGGGAPRLTFRRQGYRTRIVNTSTSASALVDSQVVLLTK